ncbi:MAG: cobyrinate a,c-diamide synthase [Deltaproteobacteria bacterium]|jgi:cobyrinic acid a,c-diamide synthase|nr:cobyrinate a,c-diamide synthase [Deltaproteobacteria bacterium]
MSGEEARRCPAVLISAPSSGQGKTTVTAALARHHLRQGRKVRVFKCGPDFLDPMILARASGAPVYQVDLWMVGGDNCDALFWEAAGEADLIIVEGVMGLFDGSPSAADLAERFGIPVLAVINAQAMAQTFPAIAHGLSTWRRGLPWAGVLANRVAGESHAQILLDSLPPDMRWFGALYRGADVELPSRHLGLVQASELDDLDRRLDRAASLLASQGISDVPPEAVFTRRGTDFSPWKGRLKGLKLAVARDDAFSFIYQGNLDLWRLMGAEISFFSPVAGDPLPGCDALYLPGGYPELHLEELASNRAAMDGVRRHFESDRPILAECGGMLYLLEELGFGGASSEMAGILPGRAALTGGLRGLGLMSADLPEGTLRGHSFHHSSLNIGLEPVCRAKRQDRRRQESEDVFRVRRLTASYVHFYLPSNPEAAARLFAA